MANTNSTSEKGHAKNVANFKTLTTRCTSFPGFNPANSDLQPAALAATFASGDAVIDAVRTANVAYKLRVAERATAFRPISKMITRLGKALKSSPGISAAVRQDYIALSRKYRGSRKEAKANAPAATPDGLQPEQISVAQLSYDSRVAHFLDIKSFLAALPTYASNEPDLSTAGIAATATALDTANQAVVVAIANLGNERANRNAVLYAPETGLVATGYQLKDYISSKYGGGSPQWKQISQLAFSRK